MTKADLFQRRRIDPHMHVGFNAANCKDLSIKGAVIDYNPTHFGIFVIFFNTTNLTSWFASCSVGSLIKRKNSHTQPSVKRETKKVIFFPASKQQRRGTCSSQSQGRRKGRRRGWDWGVFVSIVALAMRICEFGGGGAPKGALKASVYLFGGQVQVATIFLQNRWLPL